MEYRIPNFPDTDYNSLLTDICVKRISKEVSSYSEEEKIVSEIVEIFINKYWKKFNDSYKLCLLCSTPDYVLETKVTTYWGLWKKMKREFNWVSNLKDFTEKKIKKHGYVRYVGISTIPILEFKNALYYKSNNRYCVILLIDKSKELKLFIEHLIPYIFSTEIRIDIDIPQLINIICNDGGGLLIPYGNFDFGGYYLDFLIKRGSEILKFI